MSDETALEQVVAQLRREKAAFALLFGSRARGEHRAGSDFDVAAWWAGRAPQSFDVLLPPDFDLVVLNHAPLELAGRIALDGVLLYDDDPPARVAWVATTRKIYADELPRISRAHREFAESVRHGR